MAGSIRERPEIRPNLYELRIFLGRDALASSGRVPRRSRTFHGTRRRAERELARLLVAEQVQASAVLDEAARA